MVRFLIRLNDNEREALAVCANHERRAIRDQAAVLIRESLKQRGLLTNPKTAVFAGHQNDVVQNANND